MSPNPEELRRIEGELRCLEENAADHVLEMRSQLRDLGRKLQMDVDSYNAEFRKAIDALYLSFSH